MDMHVILGECVLMCLEIWWGGTCHSCSVINTPDKICVVMLRGLVRWWLRSLRNAVEKTQREGFYHSLFQREKGWMRSCFLAGLIPHSPWDSRYSPQYTDVFTFATTAPAEGSSLSGNAHALYSVYPDSSGLSLQPRLPQHPPQTHLAMVSYYICLVNLLTPKDDPDLYTSQSPSFQCLHSLPPSNLCMRFWHSVIFAKF